jgi:hypothetical protein
MRKNDLNQITEEIQLSLETIDAKKVSLVEEFNNWNTDVDHIPRTHWDESPDPSFPTKMVPCPPCKWG